MIPRTVPRRDINRDSRYHKRITDYFKLVTDDYLDADNHYDLPTSVFEKSYTCFDVIELEDVPIEDIIGGMKRMIVFWIFTPTKNDPNNGRFACFHIGRLLGENFKKGVNHFFECNGIDTKEYGNSIGIDFDKEMSEGDSLFKISPSDGEGLFVSLKSLKDFVLSKERVAAIVPVKNPDGVTNLEFKYTISSDSRYDAVSGYHCQDGSNLAVRKIVPIRTDFVDFPAKFENEIVLGRDYYDYKIESGEKLLYVNDDTYDESVHVLPIDISVPSDFSVKFEGGHNVLYFKDDLYNKSIHPVIPENLVIDGLHVAKDRGNLKSLILVHNYAETICTSAVTDMTKLFLDENSFNRDIRKWDVSNVTTMNNMFQEADLFNQDISGWNVSSVNSMTDMFAFAKSFNQDISGWDMSNVTTTKGMFYGAKSFNGDIRRWNVANVTTMKGMFYRAIEFNGDIRRWNVSKVIDMNGMFYGATNLNQDISKWNVAKVKNMENMFDGATNLKETFKPGNIFNSFNVKFEDGHNVLYINDDIYNKSIHKVILENLVVDGFHVATDRNNLKGLMGYHNAETICTSLVTNMKDLFFQEKSFNQDISGWDVSNVTNMNSMFEYATSFNKDIGSWDVSKVDDMLRMFRMAKTFNQDISRWDVSKVDKMGNMFYFAESFNQDIGRWDVSKVKNMNNMFNGAESFNQDIGQWNLSNVIFMNNMFKNAINFSQDISGWNVPKVKEMSGMFDGATSFNKTFMPKK